MEDSNARRYTLGDKELVKSKFPSVVLFEDLISDPDPEDHNLLLFGLMAHSDRFISVQGGNAVISSFFGGTNFIFAKQGPELEYGDYNYFPKFSNAQVSWSGDFHELIEYVETL